MGVRRIARSHSTRAFLAPVNNQELEEARWVWARTESNELVIVEPEQIEIPEMLPDQIEKHETNMRHAAVVFSPPNCRVSPVPLPVAGLVAISKIYPHINPKVRSYAAKPNRRD
jgi:hypothetical protein